MRRKYPWLVAFFNALISLTGFYFVLQSAAAEEILTATWIEITSLIGFVILLPLTFSAMGALILSRGAADRIGWLMLVSGFAFPDIFSSYTLAYIPTAPESLSLAQWIPLAIGSWLWFLIIIPVFLILLHFPTGSPPTPRWRWLNYTGAAAVISLALTGMFSSEIGPSEGAWSLSNPYGFLSAQVSGAIMLIGGVSLFATAFGSLASIVVRFRRAQSVEREQIKWLMYTGSLFLVSLIIQFALYDPTFGTTIQDIFFMLTLMFFPVTIAVAVFRYRLYDIDLLINKSLVYGALTLLLAALIGGSLFVVARQFESLEGGAMLAVAAAALLFGVVFQPARYRLQRAVDRYIYKIEIDYQKARGDERVDFSSAGSHTHIGEYGGLKLIGEGGMAQVYRASHPRWPHPVALKVLAHRLAGDDTFTARFRREAETIAALKHDSIVDIYDYGEENGIHYITMQLLSGPSLAEHLQAQGPLPLAEAAGYIRQIAAALDYAHRQGLVHRDVKPSNVMLDGTKLGSDGRRAVLMDFGIAKLLDKTAITKTGGVLGTFDYIAPEQIQSPGSVDGRADLYSLSIMTYQILTGSLPFTNQNPAASLIAHLSQPLPDPRASRPDLPEAAAQALVMAASKRPEERQASASEFAQALGAGI